LAAFARIRAVLGLLLCLAFVAVAVPGEGREHSLRDFAAAIGLRDIDGFVETVTSLREYRRLPHRYLTKSEARSLGWRPGDDLCRVAPGRAIGGDRFGNRERRLPDAPGRRWREADLDFACGRRGPWRLTWSDDGLIFVTPDHYATFRQVPP